MRASKALRPEVSKVGSGQEAVAACRKWNFTADDAASDLVCVSMALSFCSRGWKYYMRASVETQDEARRDKSEVETF